MKTKVFNKLRKKRAKAHFQTLRKVKAKKQREELLLHFHAQD